MIDGRFVSAETASVSVFDRGFLYGDSVFETVRTYGGVPFALDHHLQRLERSAGLVFISLPVDRSQLRAEILQSLAEARNPESYVRVTLTRGQGELGIDPALANVPTRVVIVSPLSSPPPSVYEHGVACISYRTRRASDNTPAEGAKIGNYLVAVLAMREVRAVGGHEALILDAEGRVVEGATSNVFCVIDKTLITPPTEAGILAGVTRAECLAAAESLGLSVQLQATPLRSLLEADEVFISSSIRELVPVVKVDGETIGTGRPGPIYRRLYAEFSRRVRGNSEGSWEG